MVCIYCGGKTEVTNSRASTAAKQVWRRRQCSSCRAIFTTFEKPDYLGSLVIKQTSGELDPFSKENLFISIYDSCRHRLGALTDATALTDTIISKLLLKSTDKGVIERNDVVNVTIAALKRFDKAAMVYYRAYHPL